MDDDRERAETVYEEIDRLSREPEWKRKRRLQREREKFCGLSRTEWRHLREVVLSWHNEIQNIDDFESAARFVKSDARICSRWWVTIDHVKVAIVTSR